VIVWINGAFGGGKTHTAYELVRRTEGTVLVDPELIGFGLQRSMPSPTRIDFQDLRSWREGVIEVLDAVERSGRYRAVVVPMTLVEPSYLDEVHGSQRGLGHELVHVALVASPQTLRRRLRRRAAGVMKLETWAMQQIDRCSAALATLDAHRVSNDDATLDVVVEEVARIAGVDLVRPRLGPWRAQLRRARVAVDVIRWP